MRMHLLKVHDFNKMRIAICVFGCFFAKKVLSRMPQLRNYNDYCRKVVKRIFGIGNDQNS